MAIDYSKWESRVKIALDETNAGIDDIKREFANGLSQNGLLADGEESYSTGQLFFERILLEIQTAIGSLRTANEKLIKGTDLQSQLLYDDLLKRQRKPL